MKFSCKQVKPKIIVTSTKWKFISPPSKCRLELCSPRLVRHLSGCHKHTLSAFLNIEFPPLCRYISFNCLTQVLTGGSWERKGHLLSIIHTSQELYLHILSFLFFPSGENLTEGQVLGEMRTRNTIFVLGSHDTQSLGVMLLCFCLFFFWKDVIQRMELWI